MTQGLALRGVYRQEQIGPRQAGGLFLALALALYSLGVAHGFVLYRTENIQQALHILAVPVALAGVPLLLAGTIASAKLQAPSEEEPGGLPAGVAAFIASMLALGGTLGACMMAHYGPSAE